MNVASSQPASMPSSACSSSGCCQAASRAARNSPRRKADGARRFTRAGELAGEEGRELRGADTSRRVQQAHAGAAHARRIALVLASRWIKAQ